MRAQILIEAATRRRCLYVPEAHIQIFVMKSGDRKWIVAAFRTDGYYRMNDGLVPTVQHLQQNYRLVRETDVAEDIVEFAVRSERLRQQSVGDIADILKQSVRSGDREGGFRDFLALLEHERTEEEDPEAGDRTGEEINRILSETGGHT